MKNATGVTSFNVPASPPPTEAKSFETDTLIVYSRGNICQ